MNDWQKPLNNGQKPIGIWRVFITERQKPFTECKVSFGERQKPFDERNIPFSTGAIPFDKRAKPLNKWQETVGKPHFTKGELKIADAKMLKMAISAEY